MCNQWVIFFLSLSFVCFSFSFVFLFVPLFFSCVLAEVLVSLWGLNMEHMCQNTGRDQCHVVNVSPRAQIVVKSSCFQFRCLDPVYGSEAMGRDHKRARTQPREQMMLNPHDDEPCDDDEPYVGWHGQHDAATTPAWTGSG